MRFRVITLTIGLIALSQLVYAQSPKKLDIPQDKAIRAILGEAENQGFIGMVAVGEGLRNRGSLKGVNGFKAIVVKDGNYYRKSKKGLRKIEPAIVAQATKAWEASKTSNLVHGADHWENVTAYGVPYWAHGMWVTFIHKDHEFYKAVSHA